MLCGECSVRVDQWDMVAVYILLCFFPLEEFCAKFRESKLICKINVTV